MEKPSRRRRWIKHRLRRDGLSLTGVARRIPYGVGSSIVGLLMDYADYLLSMLIGGSIALLDPILYFIFFRGYDRGSTSIPNSK